MDQDKILVLSPSEAVRALNNNNHFYFLIHFILNTYWLEKKNVCGAYAPWSTLGAVTIQAVS
jgi:hypothetical protein